MIISHKHQFIFIEIPKTASTSLHTFLCHQGCNSDRDFRHASALSVRDLPEWNDYFKFAIVRNPYDRAVSWYEYRRRPEVNESRSMKDLSFKEFLVQDDSKACYEFICDEDYNILIDYVGRYENLNNDVSHIMETIGISFDCLAKLNESSARKFRHYGEYFYDETKELLSDNYKMDLSIFNYE
jgi:hypothetical protein